MKIVESEYNPLPKILKLIPVDKLTMGDVRAISEELGRGGVVCDTLEEVMSCIKLLDEVGFLTLEENNEYFRITKKYGK